MDGAQLAFRRVEDCARRARAFQIGEARAVRATLVAATITWLFRLLLVAKYTSGLTDKLPGAVRRLAQQLDSYTVY